MIKPITPDEVVKLKKDQLPDMVIDTFNRLIAKNLQGSVSVVYQKDIIKALAEVGISSTEAFANHWLDVEDVYREAGWSVYYDKPAYNESYSAFFRFRKPR